MFEHLVCWHPEIDQTRDFVHVAVAHRVYDAERRVDGSKQTARAVVALEGKVEQYVHFFCAELISIEGAGVDLLLESWKGPSCFLDQPDGAPQVLFHGLTD